MRLREFYISVVVFVLIVLVCSCKEAQRHKVTSSPYEKLPPPPPRHGKEEYCDSLKSRTYRELRLHGIELITGDFTEDDEKRIVFERLLKERFNMSLFFITDTNLVWPNCVQPIMDSAISAQYGPRGKDSIILLLNKIVEDMSGEEVP